MKIFFFLVFPLLISCETIKKESTLYARYIEYSTEVKKENIKALYSKYFSRNLLEVEDIDDLEVIDQLLFKNYMKTSYNYFEKKRGNKGCVTINGFDEENEPIAFNLEFISLNGKWLINNIHVLLLDKESKFSNVAKCPSDYKNSNK